MLAVCNFDHIESIVKLKLVICDFSRINHISVKVCCKAGNNDMGREVALNFCSLCLPCFWLGLMLHLWLLDEREPVRPAITVQPVSGSLEEGGGVCQTLALKSLLKHENTFLWALCIAPFFPSIKTAYLSHKMARGPVYSRLIFPIGMERNFVCSRCRHNCRSQVIDLSLSALISWFMKSIIGF